MHSHTECLTVDNACHFDDRCIMLNLKLWNINNRINWIALNLQCVPLTRYDFKLSTTHASSASFPIVTVMFGIGSAKRGKFSSVLGKKKKRRHMKNAIR